MQGFLSSYARICKHPGGFAAGHLRAEAMTSAPPAALSNAEGSVRSLTGGGYIAARGFAVLSTRYGKIEVPRRSPRAATPFRGTSGPER
jgi:hypothetical protein